MRIKLCIAAIALTVLTLGSVAPSRATDLFYASGPGGPFVGYTVPFLVVSQGDAVTYMNADAFEHDVVARTVRGNPTDPGSPPVADWCPGFGFTDPLTCPAFWTPLIGIAGSTPMYGLDDVVPGVSYEFYCTIHGNMDGTLVVLP